MKALSSMERTKQVEAIHGFNQMKGNLMEYLGKFARNGKVVRQEDILEFFEGMRANKRRKVSHIPNFCR
jgi:E3 ubiquitin-protein ligase UBR7